jgi:hypothetical protein
MMLLNQNPDENKMNMRRYDASEGLTPLGNISFFSTAFASGTTK